MEYIKLGQSDLLVSRICLGCMSFGEAQSGMHSWTLAEEPSREIIKYALDQGINFFDTAMAYQGGTSEAYLGRALRDFADRQKVVVATKFLPRTKEQIEQGISQAEHIEHCLNASLERLGMDYVDLYILHKWDENTPIEETLAILHQQIVKGKVRYIGISNCYAYQIAMANEIAKAKGYEPFISVQGHYNLIFREEEREMKRYCDQAHVAMTPYSALASGRLAKKPGELSQRLVSDSYAKGKYDSTHDVDQRIIDRVMELADQKGVSMTEIALGWLLQKVAAPIMGATKKSHIDSAVKAVQVSLTEQEMAYLEALYVPHRMVGMMADQ